MSIIMRNIKHWFTLKGIISHLKLEEGHKLRIFFMSVICYHNRAQTKWPYHIHDNLRKLHHNGSLNVNNGWKKNQAYDLLLCF